MRVRELRKSGILVRLQLRDGSIRELSVPHVSLGLNADESFEFYRLPSTRQIINFHLYGIAPAEEEIVNSHAITQFFAQSLSDVLHVPTDAHYVYVKGSILVADDAPGQSLPIDEIVAQMKDIVRQQAVKTISIASVDTPARVQSANLMGQRELAEILRKSRGFQVYSGEYAWTLSGATLLPMLTYDSNSKSLIVDEEKLYAHIKTLAHSLITEPLLEPQFAINNGRLAVAREGKPGHDIDVHTLATKINDWIAAKAAMRSAGKVTDKREMVSLAYLTTMPRYSLAMLSALRITDLVGTAKTSFKGSSADRIHNISLGASRVTGFLVQPGEEFSLVQSIGYAEKENGYKEEYVIKGDRSRKEAGGGLCQVATTFFRAALDAGLKITERHNHRYVVGYYGPGLDAGIYAIDHDFRFINDFASPLLVQVRIEGTNLIVEFFGHGDRRTAVTTKPLITEILPPPPPDFRFSKSIPFGKTECTDHPREGMTSYATTTIRYQSGEVRSALWKSTYAPWPKICLIGTGGLDIYQQDD
ncbi:MAG TPA: VanW family protein [Candidatus Paceibacterota bacterium]|nr:VanW family protein [Candidatus Paceibacterota bacterium]